MSISTHANKIIGIPHARVEILALTRRERIDVMYDNAVVNLVSFKAEIASKISRDNLGASLSPNIALVEALIQPPRSAESLAEKYSIE